MIRNSSGQASVRTIAPLAAIGVLALAAAAYAISGSSDSSTASKPTEPTVTTELSPSSVAETTTSTTVSTGSTAAAHVSFGRDPGVLNTGSVAPGERGGAPVADPTASAAPRLGAPVVSEEPTTAATPPPTAAPSKTTAPGTPPPGQTLGSPPVTKADAVTAVGGVSVVIDLLANDSDPDGDLNPASLILTSLPQAGKAVLGKGGKVTYTPTITFEGTDTFSYWVCDLKNNCAGNMATITVTLSPSLTTTSTDAPPPPPDGTN